MLPNCLLLNEKQLRSSRRESGLVGSVIVLDGDLGTPFAVVPIQSIEVAAFGLS